MSRKRHAPTNSFQLFSPLLVPQALLLFQPGHLVLKGTQGSGKSMLLTLLSPEIQVAYARAKIRCPIPSEMVISFVSAGINLTRCGILDFGQRPIERNGANDSRLFPLYFADFLNYWVVRDILQSIKKMETHQDVFPFLKLKRKGPFISAVSSKECWFGFLQPTSDLDSLLRQLDSRIAAYRKFHLANVDYLPDSIMETKTVIGEPISQVSEAMRESGLIPSDVPLFVRIDQHEVLSRSDDLRRDVGIEYRRIINKALSTRDPRVSYRVGTTSLCVGR